MREVLEEQGSATQPLVEICDLSFSYKTPKGDTVAIEALSATLMEGEFVCLLGPSGCGKSTLLRILAGLEPSGARKPLGGLHWSSPTRQRIGMIFQGPSVLPWLSVEENVGYGVERSVPRIERRERVRGWIERMGLTTYAKRRGYELSGGMAQRVAIARALAADAELLLLDEPFAAVDEPTRLLLQNDLIEAWQATRATVVFVTHSIQEAILLADRILLLTARPASVRSIVVPPFERPRENFSLPKQPGYAELAEELWGQLREEMLCQREQ